MKKDDVFKLLRNRIMFGEYHAGEKLPGEVLLATELGVSRMTLRSALQMLRHAEMIRTVERSGNYVADYDRIQKKYLVLFFGDEVDNMSIASLYLVQELQKSLAEINCKLEMLSCTQLRKNLSLSQWQKRLARGGISGIFVAAGNYVGNERELLFLKESALPVVLLLGTEADCRFNEFSVMYRDSKKIFADGIKYLISLGHKRIATIFLSDSMRGFNAETYVEFLDTAGIGESKELVRYFKKKTQIPSVVRKLMSVDAPPTAVMCFCDTTAMYVLDTLNELGFQIPEEVSVMGFCGYKDRLFTLKPLSVVNFHYDISAAEAVRTMQKSHEWFYSETKVNKMIPHEIVVRKTTALCPHARS